jgi:hypothetical protein
MLFVGRCTNNEVAAKFVMQLARYMPVPVRMQRLFLEFGGDTLKKSGQLSKRLWRSRNAYFSHLA